MEEKSTFFDQIKEWINQVFNGKWLSSINVIRLSIVFGVAFLIGLLVKKSFKYLVLYSLCLIIGLSAMHYFNIIQVDIIKIKSIIGLADINDWTQFTQYVAKQLQAHAVEVVASSIGLVLGFKVG